MNTAKQYTGCMLSFLSFNRNIEICVGFSFLDYLFSDKEADLKKKIHKPNSTLHHAAFYIRP